MQFKAIFDYEVKEEKREIISVFSESGTFRFLPKEFSTGSTIDVFGDRVVMLGGENKTLIDDNASFSVIKNQVIADSFRVWFEALWSVAGE